MNPFEFSPIPTIAVPEPTPGQSVTYFVPAVFHQPTQSLERWEFECITPLIRWIRPHLRAFSFHTPLVIWGHDDGTHWNVAFTRLPESLGSELLTYFQTVRYVPVALSRFAWDLRPPGHWAPISLWRTATEGWGFASEAWNAPQDLLQALPIRDRSLALGALRAIDPDGIPLTPAATRFCTALATLFQWGYPAVTLSSLYRIYRTMQWPWHPRIRQWFTHAPYWHYAWIHVATLALPRSVEQASLDRQWTAAQLAEVWPISAAMIRQTIWPQIPTTTRTFFIHGRSVVTRLATGSACEQWRHQVHPTWPALPGDADRLSDYDPPYRWDPTDHRRILAVPSTAPST